MYTSDDEIAWLFRGLFSCQPDQRTLDIYAEIRSRMVGTISSDHLGDMSRWRDHKFDVDAVYEVLRRKDPNHVFCRLVAIACYLGEFDTSTRRLYYQRTTSYGWPFVFVCLAFRTINGRLKAAYYRAMRYV